MIKEVTDAHEAEARIGRLRLLEALLFASAEPLDEETLAGRIGTEIGPLLDEYWFDAPKSAREALDRLLQGW